jgi:hypothetical protein
MRRKPALEILPFPLAFFVLSSFPPPFFPPKFWLASEQRKTAGKILAAP